MFLFNYTFIYLMYQNSKCIKSTLYYYLQVFKRVMYYFYRTIISTIVLGRLIHIYYNTFFFNRVKI